MQKTPYKVEAAGVVCNAGNPEGGAFSYNCDGPLGCPHLSCFAFFIILLITIFALRMCKFKLYALYMNFYMNFFLRKSFSTSIFLKSFSKIVQINFVKEK